MAVAATNVIANANAADQSSYATASVSVTSGRLYLVFVRNTKDTAGTANTPTVTGAGQTWEQVATVLNASDSKIRTTLFRCIAASTTSGALTIDFAGQTQTFCGWIVDEFTGMTPGANGANAIVQSTTGDSNGASVTSFSLTLAAFGDANNAVWAGIRVATATTTVTHEGGYTELVESGTTGASKAESQFKATSDTSPSWTFGSDIVAGAIAVEIAMAQPQTATPSTTALTTTKFAPTAQLGTPVTPSTTALSLTTFAPTLVLPQTVTISTKALVLTTFAPEAGTSQTVVPSTTALVLTGLAPVITTTITPVTLPEGHIHIGKFIVATPEYTLQDEIISYEEMDDGTQRPNVVVVDGETDSWTEYARSDLTSRDIAVNRYFDLPELKDSGSVANRAVEEIQQARVTSSPGGDITGPRVLTTSRMDPIFWIDQHGNKYQTRIEGKRVEFNQSDTPFQHAGIDTGAIIFCPPEDAEETYIARDPFDRDESAGLGDAVLGGTWVIT